MTNRGQIIRLSMAMPAGLPEGWSIRKKVDKKRSVTTQLYGTADYRVVDAQGNYVAVLFASRAEPALPAKGSDTFKPGDVWQITTVDSTQPGSGWGAYVRQEFARDVSATGGYVVSDTNLSQSGQRFWDKLHANPQVHREPFPRQIQRNYVDDPSKPRGTQEWLAEPPESTQYKYRLAELSRRAMPMPTQLPEGLTADVTLWYSVRAAQSRAQMTLPEFYTFASSAGPDQINELSGIDLSLRSASNKVAKQVAYVNVRKGPGASRAFYVISVRNMSHVRGLGAWLRMEMLKMVSALGGTLESDGSVSESAQVFWTKLYQDPNVKREPRKELAFLPGEKFRVQRNMLDKPVDEWTSMDGGPLTKKKNPELYHKYRLAALSRTAGRFELPDGTLDAVWQLVEPTVVQMLNAGSPEKHELSAPNAVFSASKYPGLRQYAQNGSTFSVTLLLEPTADAFYSFDDHRVILHVPKRTKFASPDFVERSLQELKSSLAHELVHHQQEIMTEAMGLSKDTLVGGPGRKNRVELADEPTDFYGQNLPHVQRDVEFYPNLESNLQEFDQMVQYNLAHNRKFPLSSMISAYLLEELRISKTNYSRYKKYVREFVRAVQDRYDANGRPKVSTQPKAADLARTAGRFELPPGVLNHVWNEIQETVSAYELPETTKQSQDFVFPYKLFKDSQYPGMAEQVKDGAFVVTVKARPDLASPQGSANGQVENAPGYFDPRSMAIVLHIASGRPPGYYRSVLAHELLHLQQALFSRGLSKKYRDEKKLNSRGRYSWWSMELGGPGKNKRVMPTLAPGEELVMPPNIDGTYRVRTPDGDLEYRYDTEHRDRDVEFYTNLESNVHHFDMYVDTVSASRRWSGGVFQRSLREMITDFINVGGLRISDKNPARKAKFVREFVRAVNAKYAPGKDYLGQKEQGYWLKHQKRKEAYAKAVRGVDSKEVIRLLGAVFIKYLEDLTERYGDVQTFVKTVNPEQAAMLADNDYDIYKKHVIKLPKPKIAQEDINSGLFTEKDLENIEPISVIDAVAELQRRYKAAAQKQ